MTETENSTPIKKQTNLKGVIFVLIIILGLIVFLPSIALILFIGILPTLGAMISDPSSMRAQTFCVGVCNIAGLVPMVHELYVNNFRLQHAYEMIHDDINLLLVLCASAVGWGIFFIVPVVTVAFYKTRDKSMVVKMVRRYDELKDTWGDALPTCPTIERLKEMRKK